MASGPVLYARVRSAPLMSSLSEEHYGALPKAELSFWSMALDTSSWSVEILQDFDPGHLKLVGHQR